MSNIVYNFIWNCKGLIPLVQVFESRSPSRVGNYLVGYGAPLLLVLTSLTADHIHSAPSDHQLDDMCYKVTTWGKSNTQTQKRVDRESDRKISGLRVNWSR